MGFSYPVDMWKLGSNDWIKYGWTKDFNSNWEPDDQLFIDFSNNEIPIQKLTAIDASHFTIDHITKTCPPPYTLMCSGGVDSQAMLYAWHTSGHKFDVMSVRYKSLGQFFNEHDLPCLSLMSKKFNIPVNYFDLDIIHLLENELPLLVKINDCASPHICTYIKFINAVQSGTAIFSGNFLTHIKESVVDYTLLGTHRHSLINNRVKVIPNFFTFTPELAYSFVRGYKTINNSTKDNTYLNNGFDIFIPEKKFTGFEKIKEYYDSFEDRVDNITRLTFISKASSRVFDLLFRYPYEGSGLCKQTHKTRAYFKNDI